MFGNLGMGELLVVLLIILLFFGAKRIPEISASFGKGIREFKRNVNDVERSITDPDNTPRYDNRLPSAEPRRDPAPAAEERPEPKRLI
jgi:sec-independent protein translocase protein TatA